MRKLGLEWFWRLFGFLSKQKVNRKKRIKNAVIKFPWKFFKWIFVWPLIYRENVACLLFKKEGDKYKILLVERQNEKDHWQLPQGGTDGESVEDAGKKELSEETGTLNFKFIASYKKLYKYRFWDDIAGKYGSGGKPRKHSGYRGQRQGLYIAEYFGNDNDIKINIWDHTDWKWVDADNLVNEVHLTRKKPTEIYLNKFKQNI
jgi:8-oxo-dGTP pyrophosphatase MutT (NUDIX family)